MVDGRMFDKTGAALLNARVPHRVVVLAQVTIYSAVMHNIRYLKMYTKLFKCHIVLQDASYN